LTAPNQLGSLELANRLVMALLTRNCGSERHHSPPPAEVAGPGVRGQWRGQWFGTCGSANPKQTVGRCRRGETFIVHAPRIDPGRARGEPGRAVQLTIRRSRS